MLAGVLAGEVSLPRRHTGGLLEELRGPDRDARRPRVSELAAAPLSDREWEVVHLLAARLGAGEFAPRLGISEVIVRRHVSSLLGKLRLPDRAMAIAFLRSAE